MDQALMWAHRQSTGASMMVEKGMVTGCASFSASEHGTMACRTVNTAG